MQRDQVVGIVEENLREFCLEFLENPYLCYTEHGLHARFYSRLLSSLPDDLAYFAFRNERVCSVQKEYRTKEDLGKGRRQNWDISVIDAEQAASNKSLSYDYLPLSAVVEFGLNASVGHLEDDIDRLGHSCEDTNIYGKPYIAHFYRISDNFSGRDLSPETKQNLSDAQSIMRMIKKDITVYFAVVDMTRSNVKGFWIISKNGIEEIRNNNCTEFKEK